MKSFGQLLLQETYFGFGLCNADGALYHVIGVLQPGKDISSILWSVGPEVLYA